MGVRIGCYSAFWGDSISAARQFFNMASESPPEFIVADYLAEVTMGILAKSRKSGKGGTGKGGYVKEFVDQVYVPNAKKIAKAKVKVITNAGGLDPVALKVAIEKAAESAGIVPLPKVAAVFGDDLLQPENWEKIVALRKAGNVQKFAHLDGLEEDGETWPAEDSSIISLNAYMGCKPIVDALNDGADIIVTGRVVDSALVLGPLIHKFNWSFDSYDLLAAGSLAGHIIECGCHTTGGNFTDWELSAFSANGGWANMGYPIVEVFNDGDILVSKVPNTGGIVTFGTVTEQMVYEILDPSSYILPDVIADFRHVTVKEVGKDLVRVSGVKGRAPTKFLKTSGVYQDGYKISGELMIGGKDAKKKAQAVGNAIVQKVKKMLAGLNMEDFSAVEIETLGAEHIFGPHTKHADTREVVLRLTAIHSSKTPLMLLAREMAPAATCMAPGITGSGTGRPMPSANLSHFSALIPKSSFPGLLLTGASQSAAIVPYQDLKDTSGFIATQIPQSHAQQSHLVEVPLIDVCYGRSGDKGDTCNIGMRTTELGEER
ncbi:hypothetical protein HDU97_007756 [Phlyctochytrium planicorne]|nr:hypothetical protein HDU97_007756 [Phlyctochytrium planicorne]